jgi:hypothetical protein
MATDVVETYIRGVNLFLQEKNVFAAHLKTTTVPQTDDVFTCVDCECTARAGRRCSTAERGSEVTDWLPRK